MPLFNVFVALGIVGVILWLANAYILKGDEHECKNPERKPVHLIESIDRGLARARYGDRAVKQGIPSFDHPVLRASVLLASPIPLRGPPTLRATVKNAIADLLP